MYERMRYIASAVIALGGFTAAVLIFYAAPNNDNVGGVAGLCATFGIIAAVAVALGGQVIDRYFNAEDKDSHETEAHATEQPPGWMS